MKRITAFMALVALLLMSVFGAHAAVSTEQVGGFDIVHNQDNSASSTVVYGIDEAYTVTIPADVNLVLGETETQEISLTGVYMPLKKQLSLSIRSLNCAEGATTWNVVLDTDTAVKLPYSIKQDGNAVANGATLLVCPGGTNEILSELVFNVEQDPVQSGTYLDTLTFDVSIDVIN